MGRVPEITVRHFSGDGTGVLDVLSITRVYTHHNIKRLRSLVNFDVQQGGELILPLLTELVGKRNPSLEVHGAIYGIRELRIHSSSHAKLHLSGHSGCFNCSSKYMNADLRRKYWFNQVIVKAGGKFEIVSAQSNVSKAVQIHTSATVVQYNGMVICDAMELFTKYMKTEHDSRFFGSGKAASNGLGPGTSCGVAGSGAGHGGKGGRSGICRSGYQCRTHRFVEGGITYGNVCNPVLSGSTGGHGGQGGGVMRLFISTLVDHEGFLVSNGNAGNNGGGGGSGGSVWFDGEAIDGHGSTQVVGGNGDYTTTIYGCNNHRYGGGGGGGYIRTQSPQYINRAILRNANKSTAVAGGRSGGGSAKAGEAGKVCFSGNECSGNGIWSSQERKCVCNKNYFGVSCSYYCEANLTCLGHGQCTTFGGCNCDYGYVGFRCEHFCNSFHDCSGNGVCDILGKCVCNSCYGGDNCGYLCSGSGTCEENMCKCNNCYSGEYCESECSGHGRCVNGSCLCDKYWFGSHCERGGCPGLPVCSGNGLCNSALHQCYCNPGWKGDDCSILDCPGTPNCNARGVCVSSADGAKCVNCSKGWMGAACDEPCLHGVQSPMNSGLCRCDPCYGGKGCTSLCLERGFCDSNSTCICDPDVGWRGPVCQIPGCPGVKEDCSGHGECNAARHLCTCYEGWTGKACDVADCPGAPNCFGRGFCNDSFQTPRCQNCSRGYMGPACNDPCINGLQTPMDSGNCVCFPGFVGVGCDSECSEHGKVFNGTCKCDIGWRGTLCDIPGCPGVDEDCSGHGSCNGAIQKCTCFNGWSGEGKFMIFVFVFDQKFMHSISVIDKLRQEISHLIRIISRVIIFLQVVRYPIVLDLQIVSIEVTATVLLILLYVKIVRPAGWALLVMILACMVFKSL